MRSILTFVIVVLASINALATSTSTNAGYLSWNSAWATDYWTPHIASLSHPGGDPNMWPGTFSTSSLAVTCTPICGIGDRFSIGLSLTNFQSGLGNLTGTINLQTAPIVIKSASGIAIAHFTLTGVLVEGSFSLDVNVRGFATMAYNLNSGQLQVSSVGYNLPEPSSVILLSSGLVLFVARRRSARTKAH